MANTTWDPSTVTAVTLSGGNLVATNTGTTSTSQGAHVPSSDGKTGGKYYFEVTLTTFTGGGGVGVGVGTTAAVYSTLSTAATHGDMCFVVGHTGSGTIIIDASGNTGFSIGARTTGDVIGVAVDLNNYLVWFRLSPSGLWDSTLAHDPTLPPGTGGGFGIPTGTIVPFVTFGNGLTGTPVGASSNVFTANFGDSAFSGAVPTGYTSGWPSAVTILTGVGSATGAAAVSGVGHSTATSVGSSTGTAAAAGVGSSRAQSTGTSTGAAAVAGVGVLVAQSVGTSTGTSSVSGIGRAVLKAIGTAAGQAAVNGASPGGTIGVATSQASSLGISSSIILSVGTANGSADVEGIECVPVFSTVSAVGQADGQASVIGISLNIANSIGRADGTSSVLGIAKTTLVYTGTSDGVSFVQGISNQPAILFPGAILLAGL